MPAQFGHHIQEKTFKVLRQYKERQPDLLKMTWIYLKCYSYAAGSGVAYTLKKRMVIKGNYAI